MLSGEDFGYLRDNEQNRLGIIVKKAILIGSVLFSIACFIYITINAYYFVYSDRDSNIKVIKSPPEPIKIVDNNNSENAVKDIDKTIYDSIVGNKNLTRENLNQVKIIAKADTPIASEQARRVIVERPEAPAPVIAQNQRNNNPALQKPTTPAKISNGNMVVYDAANPQKSGVNQEKSTPEKSVQVFDESKSKAKAIPRGAARVQVAALASKSGAIDYWSNLKKGYPALFSGLDYFISEVNLGAKGTFYRLQIGNFHGQPDAEDFCRRFIAQAGKSKADCIIVE